MGGAYGATLPNENRLLHSPSRAAPLNPMAVTPPISDYLRRYAAAARRYAAEHFTDPDVTLDDFAAFYDLSPRTARRCLRADGGPSWRGELLRLRMDRAAELLDTASSSWLIEDIATLCGYRSAPAFAKAFRSRFGLTPHEFRRGKGGPARGGGPTGAFAHGSRAAAAAGAVVSDPLADVYLPPYCSDGASMGRPMRAGERAIINEEIRNAQLRLDEQRLLEGAASPRGEEGLAAIADEYQHPTRMRHNAAYWCRKRREFEAWVAANEDSAR